MTPLAPLLTAFLREHLPVEKGQSPRTCESYTYAFRLLLDFASKRLGTRPSKLHVEQLDAKLVLAFLEHLETDRKNSAATRNARLAAINAFMRYVEFREAKLIDQVAQIRAIPYKRHDHPLIQHLVMNEIRAVLDVPDLGTRLGIRDRAMMHLCFAGGLRVSELVGLPLADVTLQPSPSIRVHGKGRKDRCLPLWKETAQDLRRWLAVRGDVRTPELFVNAWRGDDSGRVRVRPRQARPRRSRAMHEPQGALRLAPPAPPQLRADASSGHARHPQGEALAGAQRREHH